MREISAEETYRKLKHKVDYNGACAIYSQVFISLGNEATSESIRDIVILALLEVGWTLDELYEEWVIQERMREYESKYG